MRITSPRGARLRHQVRLALLGTTLAVAAPGAMAAMINVNSSADSTGGDQCTLRDAITAANTNTATGGCIAGDDADDTVLFGDGVAGATITLGGTALPTIMSGSTLTIGTMASEDDESDSAAGVTIDADQMSRIFTNQGNLTLTGLTLVNGQTAGGDASADDRSGGAILNDDDGVLTVNGGAMNNNTADRAGGAIEEASSAAAGTTAVTLNDVDFSGNNAGMTPGNGGVLHVSGTGDVDVEGGVFSGNISEEGGALWNNGGTLTVTDATFTENVANGTGADMGGGAIFGQVEGANGTIVISGSTFMSNMAGNPDDGEGDSSASGGAILTGDGTTLNISDSVFRMNSARRAGGAIEVLAGSMTTLDNVTASGNNAGMNPGNGGVLHVTGDASVDVTGGVYSDNTAVEGGAFWNNQGEMSFDGASIVGNEATGAESTQGGGGIYAETNDAGADSGTLTIMNTRISGNSASGAAGSGGGILVAPGATANITDSRIFANTANRAGGGIENAAGSVTLTGVMLGGTAASDANDAGTNPGNGGGLHIGGAGTTDVNSSSVGYNTAVEGGGLWNSGAGTLNVNTSTVSNNTAERGAGVYLDGAGGTINLDEATVTGNNGEGVFAVEDAGGSITITSSLIADNDTNLGDGITADEADGNVTGDMSLFNGEYRLFGGPTATQPLAMDSLALDTNANCDAAGTDQRGAERQFDVEGIDNGGLCDSGAFELTDDPVLTVTANGPDTATANDSDATSVIGFTLTNDEDDAATVAGFSGYINRGSDMGEDGEIPAGFNLAGAALTVYLDTNANGTFDSGENSVGSGTVDDNGSTFTVTFNGGGESIPANDSMSYVVTAELADDEAQVVAIGSLMPVYAGGALLGLVGLLSVGGVRRRTQLLLIVAALALTLTACSDDDNDANVNLGNNGGNNGGDGDMGGGDNGMAMGQVQFVVEQLNASGTDDLVIGDNLPLNGPTVSFAVDSDDMSSDN